MVAINYAVRNKADRVIHNVIRKERDAPFQAGEGYEIVELATIPEAERVYRTATVEEIDAVREDHLNALQSGGLKAVFTLLFQILNEVRVLKGQSPLTAAQFRAYLKARLD